MEDQNVSGEEVFPVTPRHGFQAEMRVFAKRYYIIFLLFIVLSLWLTMLLAEQRRYAVRLHEDMECWRNHGLSVGNTMKRFLQIEDVFIPSSVDEAPQQMSPSVPKHFLIEEKDYCSRTSLKAIVYVHSSISSVEKRNFTRQSWGSVSPKLGVVFFVGKAKNTTEQEIVNHESKVYHDIILGHYTDEYKLLTYKALSALFWLTKNCKHVPWVVHADDDVLLDVRQFFKFLNRMEATTIPMEIFGLIFRRSVVQREKKWKVDYVEYPCRTYPSYCAGSAWFTSMNVVHALLAEVPHVKYLWVDDVFVTGLLAEKAGINRTDVNFVNFYFKESQVGKTIAWLNVRTNRTSNWKSLLSYYGDTAALC